MQGLTLVEVMIAMVVLSVGLLGLAGLQIHGLRGTSNANSRVQATFILSGMSERMHANPTEFTQNLTYNGVALNANACGAQPPSCNGGGCTTAQLFTHDNYEVCMSMAANLPAGATLNIVCTAPCVAGIPGSVDGSPHTLTLNWSEVRDASLGGNLGQNIAMTIQPFLSNIPQP